MRVLVDARGSLCARCRQCHRAAAPLPGCGLQARQRSANEKGAGRVGAGVSVAARLLPDRRHPSFSSANAHRRSRPASMIERAARRGLGSRRIRGYFVMPAAMPAPTRGDGTVRSRARHSTALAPESIQGCPPIFLWRPLFGLAEGLIGTALSSARIIGRDWGPACLWRSAAEKSGLRSSCICRWRFGLTLFGRVRKADPFLRGFAKPFTICVSGGFKSGWRTHGPGGRDALLKMRDQAE